MVHLRLVAMSAGELEYDGHLPYPETAELLEHKCSSAEDKEVGMKFIREMNRALKQIHGHDCNGAYYLSKGLLCQS